jgi:uncharacterized repeat protein (TIGR03806 family)
VLDHRVLADSTYNCAGWGRDHQGETYLVALSGEIFELERNPAAKTGVSPFPRLLSESGLFRSASDGRPSPGVLPYTINAPAWHDGASMSRFLAVPGDGKINCGTSRGWDFPDGAVLAQNLSIEMEPGKPASKQKIETRLITRQGGEWFAYTYEWNDQQTNARLVAKEGKDRKFLLRDPEVPGGVRQHTWRYPSRSECMVCHSRAANFVLGLNTVQMNRVAPIAGVNDNQIATLGSMGYFEPPLKAVVEKLPRLVNPYDPSAELDARARSYLHANCSHCHVADGGGNARIELESSTARDKMNLFDVAPLHGGFEMNDAKLVASGDPFRSVLYYRLSKLGGGRMPQVGSTMVDQAALDLLDAWIRSLKPPSADPKAFPWAEQRKRDETAVTTLRLAKAGPSSRATAISGLLSSTSGALRLLRVLDDRRLPLAERGATIAAATASPNPAVRDLFERFLPEEKRVRRLGTAINAPELLAIAGSAARGESLFFKNAALLCQTCHQVAGRGRDIGPDLSHIGKKYSRAQLLETIVDPSKVVDEKYTAYVLQTVDGKTYTGLLVERSPSIVRLKDSQGKIVGVAVNEVEALEAQRKSMMPEFLFRDLTAEQAADLLAYLESLK